MTRDGPRTDLLPAAEPDRPMVRMFHDPDGSELHFRYIGLHEGRHFIVNVQMPVAHESTGERLNPDEYRSVVANVLQAVMQATGSDEGSSSFAAPPVR